LSVLTCQDIVLQMKLFKEILKYSIPTFILMYFFYFASHSLLISLYDEENKLFSINISTGLFFIIWLLSFIFFLVTFNSYRRENLEMYNPINQYSERLQNLSFASNKSKKLSITYGIIFLFMTSFYLNNINEYLIYLVALTLTISLIEFSYQWDRDAKNYSNLAPDDEYKIRKKNFTDWRKISKYPLTYFLFTSTLVLILVLFNF